MRLNKKSKLPFFFSCSLIVILLSSPLVLAITHCHCDQSELFSETEYAVSDCSVDDCSERCHCNFSDSNSNADGNFNFPLLTQSHIIKLITSGQCKFMLAAPDGLQCLHSTAISRLKALSPLAIHIYSTILRI